MELSVCVNFSSKVVCLFHSNYILRILFGFVRHRDPCLVVVGQNWFDTIFIYCFLLICYQNSKFIFHNDEGNNSSSFSIMIRQLLIDALKINFIQIHFFCNILNLASFKRNLYKINHNFYCINIEYYKSNNVDNVMDFNWF